MSGEITGNSPLRDERMIRDLLGFSMKTFAASSAVVSWHQGLQPCKSIRTIGLSEVFVHDYLKLGRGVDPLSDITSTGNPIARLSDIDTITAIDESTAAYFSFIKRYGYSDEIDITLSYDGCSLATLALFGRQELLFDDERADAMLPFLSSYVACHPLSRSILRRRVLRDRFNLTWREVEVVEAVVQGASNEDIMAGLRIGLATVKTHLARAFDKLGVSSRTALAAKAAQLY